MKKTTRTSKYHSKFETRVAPLLPKGTRYEPFSLPYILELNYTPDWELPGGIILEAKGKFDYKERRKMLAVIKNNPTKDIRMVFMRNNRISKKSKITYLEWCQKHNIRASVFPELPL